jgi:hypothetical protein
MIITRTSQFSGIVRTMDLPITDEQMDKFTKGELIQRAFPHLTNAQREFILTGMTNEEWTAVFGDEDEE